MAKKKLALKKSNLLPSAKKASSKGKKSLSKPTQKGSDQWPLKRDVLFRPDRLKYVRKLEVADGCVFCTASKKVSLETLCLYQSKHSMVVLNKFPYNSGHVLVLPRHHKGDMFALTDDEFTDLHLTLKLAMKAVTETYQPGGINVGLNQGKDAGAGIPEHLHYHLIPRWAGDLNFFPLVAETKVVIENLAQSYERLQNFFKAHKETP